MDGIIKGRETIWLFSMGKRFELMAIADTADAANRYCENHRDAAVIAEFGTLVFIANRYAGVRSNDR